MSNAKAETETLMNAVFPLAEKFLQLHGEFFPYGGAMKVSGEIVNLASYDGREHPPSVDVIGLLKHGFAQGAASGEYKVTALVHGVKVVLPSYGIKSDAVAVALDHRDSYSVVAFFPYQLKNGKVSFGEVFAQRGKADVFPSK